MELHIGRKLGDENGHTDEDMLVVAQRVEQLLRPKHHEVLQLRWLVVEMSWYSNGLSLIRCVCALLSGSP